MMERIPITAEEAAIFDNLYITLSTDEDWNWVDRFNEGTEYDEDIDWKLEGF